MSGQRYPVGIDLGTTYSTLAYLDDDGQPQALRMDDDESAYSSTSYSIASAIYFQSATEAIVGNRALEFSVIDASRVASQFKRHIGEPDWHFEVDGVKHRPEELSAMVLRRLKDAAERTLGPIEEVVISVPFVFDEKRRRATQNAGRIAGFQRVELVDEPVAAALAHGHSLFQGQGTVDEDGIRDIFGGEVILVYDLGGGTFDATLLRIQADGMFDVIATDGDWQLGGVDWDDLLLKVVCDNFQKQTGIDPSADPELLQELRLKTIEAKKTLSNKPRASVPFFHDGMECEVILTRGEFKEKSEHLLERTKMTVETMLEAQDKEWNFVDRIVIVGGASRMPMVREMLELVTGRFLDMSLSPDTAIAQGAALFAALQFGSGSTGGIKDVSTVNSHPLGLMVNKKGKLYNDVILKANEKTSTTIKRQYRVANPDQGVNLIVLEGDQPNPRACVELGRINIPRVPATGHPVIEVAYSFQKNGLLYVEALVTPEGRQKPIKVDLEIVVRDTMTDDEVRDATLSLRGINIE